jgi:hypothetical protein
MFQKSFVNVNVKSKKPLLVRISRVYHYAATTIFLTSLRRDYESAATIAAPLVGLPLCWLRLGVRRKALLDMRG